MAGITIHQRVSLWLWHWKTGPAWVRNGIEMRKLRVIDGKDAARVIKIQLQDDGQVPRELVAEYQAVGFKVWGAVRPSHDPLGGNCWGPVEAAQWISDQKQFLDLQGMDLNFEREVRDADTNSNGAWSQEFITNYRQLCPTLPTHLDTVFGDFAGGINNVYTPRGCRFSVQTYWGPEGLWDDPPTNIVKWIAGAQPVIPKAVTKPLIRSVANNSGELPIWDVVFDDWQTSGLKGGGFYYIDGTDFDLLQWLIKETIRRGCAY